VRGISRELALSRLRPYLRDDEACKLWVASPTDVSLLIGTGADRFAARCEAAGGATATPPNETVGGALAGSWFGPRLRTLLTLVAKGCFLLKLNPISNSTSSPSFGC
jgi:hypothetical protein